MNSSFNPSVTLESRNTHTQRAPIVTRTKRGMVKFGADNARRRRNPFGTRQLCIESMLLVVLVLSPCAVVAQDPTPAPEATVPTFLLTLAPTTEEPTPTPPTPPPTTLSPSDSPTAKPSPEPTVPLTLEPTFIPTSVPSETLTDSPTKEPSSAPSFLPTSAPTVQGSAAPSITDSSSPSGTPTMKPTVGPTFFLSGAPSTEPSYSPSVVDSGMPSRTPTMAPSLEESAVPSRSPSDQPSSEPSITAAPSTLPSTHPSLLPSTFPSMAPSLSPQEYLVEVVMYFDDAQRLGRTSQITFHRETGDHIFNEFVSLEGLENPLYELKVGVNIKSQEATAPQEEGEGRRMLRQDLRRLQASPLEIVFDTVVSFQSLSTDLDVSSMIGGAFNTDEDRAKYLNELQSTGDRSFSSINSVIVFINGIPQEEEENPKNSGGGVNIFIIIGASAGGLALLLVGALIYLRRRQPHKETTVATSSKTSGDERVDTDIVVENQDDVSTLGDPMYAPGGMLLPGLERDDTVAASIVSGDYDYAKRYGVAESSPADPRVRADTLQSSLDGSQLAGSTTDLSSYAGLGKMDNSIFSDDSSFEQQFANMEERFEVNAPQGKLGMVIDTPSGGVPVVHAIKETSVLADRVEVGDRLLSVDDEDTTGLTAMQVSKMISQKAQNPARILVFARTRTRTMSGEIDAPR